MADDVRPAIRDIEAAWRSGVPLSYAWFEFAFAHAREKYREAKTRGATDAQRMMMVADLWARLDIGELLAFGFCISPEISKGPMPLPRHTFCDQPPNEIGSSDDIEISGWRYERVRICRNEGINWPEAPIIDRAAGKPDKRSGRPDTYPYSAQVIEFLFADDANRQLSPQKLHHKFATEFYRRFPRDKFQMDAPAVRTLRNHLSRYRQKLAETNLPFDSVP